MTHSQHPNIRYSQSWEDAEILLRALLPGPSDRIFSITSGGCNSLSLLSKNPARLVALDINPLQNHLFELKLKAIQELPDQDVECLLGVRSSSDRLTLFNRSQQKLSPEAAAYWKANQNNIRKGIMHIGKFENYLQIFRRYLLSLIHTKKTIRELLQVKTIEEQQVFFDTRWNSLRWKLVFKMFFSKTIMKRLGRSPAMFRYAASGKISEHYLQKTARAFTRASVFQNSYLNYTLLGNYENMLPHYLHKESLAGIRKASTHLQIETRDLLAFLKEQPDNSFTKFNLSDVFEPLSDQQTEEAFREILRTGTKGARLIFWNNLVERDVPVELKTFFRKENELRRHLLEDEKVFFYNDLKIYTLLK